MTQVFRNFIAGEFVSPAKAAPNLNPSNTTEVVGEYAQGTVEDLNAAVAAAREPSRPGAGPTRSSVTTS